MGINACMRASVRTHVRRCNVPLRILEFALTQS